MEQVLSDSSPEEVSNEQQSAAGGFWLWVRETSVILVFALGLSVLLRTFVFQAFYVPSGSMMDTLLVNDRIIASKLSLRFGSLERGDVIVFQDPGGWLPPVEQQPGAATTLNRVLTWIGVLPSNSGSDLVKRVIGLPGDHVKCCDVGGHILVNGKPLDESSYVKGATNTIEFDVTVPSGRYFVMGDNRENSGDSRLHLSEQFGSIPYDHIVGQVDLLIWPFNRFKTLANPLTAQAIPAATSN